MNMFARFDENPAMTLQDIKEKNVTDGRTHTPTHTHTIVPSKAVLGVDRPMKAPSMLIQKPY